MMENLAICAIASPLEKPYLGEWCEWHKATGFSKIYLCTNNWTWSNAPSYVQLVRANGRDMQRMWYQCFCTNAPVEVEWCAFIDIDEFIKPPRSQDMQSFLEGHQLEDSVCLSWRVFGSSGLHFDGDTHVLKRFTKRQAGFNPHVKQVLNVKKLRSCSMLQSVFFPTPHCAMSKWHVGQWTVDGRQIHGPCDPEAFKLKDDDAWIAHFFCKTPEEWKKKQAYGRADVPECSQMLHRRDEEFAQHDFNEVQDTTLRDMQEELTR